MTGPKVHTYGSKCRGTCGRITRSSTQSAAQHPGTVPHSGGGKCAQCNREGKGLSRSPRYQPTSPMPLSYYTPAQDAAIQRIFGGDHEILRMLGVVQ